MKKRKRHHARKAALLLLLAAAVICTSAAVYLKTRPLPSNGDNAAEKGEIITETAKELSLDTELVKAGCIGSVAKIDIITPGLDTFSMRVALYDLENERLLSETALPEGAWTTGQTENGFYAAEQGMQSVIILKKGE